MPVLQEANANIEDATGTTMSSAQVFLSQGPVALVSS